MNDISPAAGTIDAPRGLVPLVALTSMIGPFTIDTYLPSFPDIAADFGVGLGAMAQTLSVYLVAFATTTLMWGPLADALGRRRVILASMLLYLVTSFGCAFIDNLPHMLILRFLQGVGASGGMVIARAVIRDVYEGPRAQRAMAQMMMMFALAPAAAPIIGGWLHEWFGWRSVFYFLSVYGLLTMVLMLWALPETHPPHLRESLHPAALLRNYAKALRHGRFLAIVLAFCLLFAGMFLYIVGSPAIVFDHLGLGANNFGVLFVPMVGGVVLGSWFAGRLSTHVTPSRTVSGAMVLAGTAVVLNLAQARWLEPQVFSVVAPMVLYAFAVSLSTPSITVMALDCFPRNRGMASAVQAFVQMNMNALVASLAVPFVAPSLLSFALVQGVFLLVGALLWRRADAAHNPLP